LAAYLNILPYFLPQNLMDKHFMAAQPLALRFRHVEHFLEPDFIELVLKKGMATPDQVNIS